MSGITGQLAKGASRPLWNPRHGDRRDRYEHL